MAPQLEDTCGRIRQAIIFYGHLMDNRGPYDVGDNKEKAAMRFRDEINRNLRIANKSWRDIESKFEHFPDLAVHCYRLDKHLLATVGRASDTQLFRSHLSDARKEAEDLATHLGTKQIIKSMDEAGNM